ncbi:TerD family protein [Emticicia sp. 17c]|uniref:TerD family protein n=1 Tax=Emticicia sp. 17c TaxID=3127704 RepID=UPI00301C09DE
MSIDLKKGGFINLSKETTKLSKIMIGLGWEQTSMRLDLDASVFVLAADGRLLNNDYFIFYNNTKSPDKAIEHLGDNRSGSAEDDDEIILANLATITPEAKELAICISIHDAVKRGHNFGLLQDAYVRIIDVETKKEISKYDLDASHFNENALIFARIKKSGDEWYFHADSQGSVTELQGIVDLFI